MPGRWSQEYGECSPSIPPTLRREHPPPYHHHSPPPEVIYSSSDVTAAPWAGGPGGVGLVCVLCKRQPEWSSRRYWEDWEDWEGRDPPLGGCGVGRG